MKVVLSIKPKFVSKILSGEKIFEYRKKIFKQPVDTVVIYSSSPVCKFVGEFKIDDVLCDEVNNLWNLTNLSSGISHEYYKKYFINSDKAYALKIKDLKIYSTPISPFDIIPNFTPPQSFCYLKEGTE